MNLDIALQMASITLTVLLAGVAIEMANEPPITRGKKWAYRLAFILFGLSLAGVTYSQTVRALNEQTRARNEANNEQQKSAAQYGLVQGKLDNITQFIAHPPPNLDLKQVADAVRVMAGNTAKFQKEQSDAASREGLLATAPGVSAALSTIAARWWVEDDQLLNSPSLRAQPNELQKKRDELTKKYLDQANPLLPAADYLRQQLLKLPHVTDPTDKPWDDRVAAIFAKIALGNPINQPELADVSRHLGYLCQRVKSAPVPNSN
jgi:hypothetical protein